MTKRILEPNTTLFPVPVVVITAGIDRPNLFTCNRIASCSAEPPRLCISVRPMRHSHQLIRESGEFVVNLPHADDRLITDYLGVVSGNAEDKWDVVGWTPTPAVHLRTPLIAECPVNIECVVEQTLTLDSHTLFIGLVKAVHVDEQLLDDTGEISAAQGLVYDTGIVRERPTYKFRVEDLRRSLHSGRQTSS